jgi:hypothetical protein
MALNNSGLNINQLNEAIQLKVKKIHNPLCMGELISWVWNNNRVVYLVKKTMERAMVNVRIISPVKR